MKPKFLIFALLFIASTAFSQEWNLFNLNQNSYYKQQNGIVANIENFLLDSIDIREDQQVSFFNSQSRFKPECYKNIKYEYEYNNNMKNLYKIDSLIKINDTILFITDFTSKLDSFIFKPFSDLNDTWITNGITIKCSELGVLEIFGTQDSIKTFTCQGKSFDTKEFILSKNFGFIKFLPFSEFIYHPDSYVFPPYFELVGFSKGEFSAGYIQPDFSDYFHLSAGDKLFWKHYSSADDPFILSSTDYQIDSITASFISTDSVHYIKNMTIYKEDGSISQISNHHTSHLRKDEGVIVANNTSWFGLKYNSNYHDEVFFSSLYFIIEKSDTISFLNYWLSGLLIDTSNCTTGQIVDYGLETEFSTRAGIVYTGSYSWGENSTTLIGSIINGEKFGITQIPNGITTNSIEKIKVYPNPFDTYIKIEAHNSNLSRIEIYDIFGCLILINETNNERIDLQNLSKGMYILKIIDSKNRSTNLKIYKQ